MYLFAVHSLYTTLCSHPVITLLDSTKLFYIDTNASNTAVGGVFTQEHAFVYKTIAFLSKTFTRIWKKHSINNHELIEIIICCKAWCPSIDMQPNIVITDHKLLIHLHA